MELGNLKTYLGITDESQDPMLQFIMADVEESIKNYCNIEEIPEGLLNTAYRMAMDVYRNENIGHEEGACSVSSLTEGDTSMSFGGTSDEGFKDSLLKNYEKTLRRYRKVVFS